MELVVFLGNCEYPDNTSYLSKERDFSKIV